ncbi:DUF4382 domain-containing protein [Marivirga sp.]|uniref:DUF4382 domain-containing protein n=1 Tax=Marivirga sp. TaxID=2018662 RepID=UPI003DA792B1
MKKQSKLLSKLLLAFFFVATTLLIVSCDSSETNGDGKLVLNVTDAPVDEEGVTGVYITFTGIEYQIEGEAWQEAEEFGDPVTINLLDLQNGTTSLLGEFNAGAGNYTGLRFKLDAATRDGSNSSNAGCYITFEDGTETPLFVPSGEQTGYKAVGTFTVPVNGTVEVTADFDLRKSVTKAGATGMYILKPTIRVIVNNQAGEIAGSIANTVEESNYVVYAYDAGSYDESESADPAEGDTRFPNAVSGTGAQENGDYVLAFLAEGDYDVVFTSIDAEGNVTVNGIVEGATVESNSTTQVDFEL